MGMKIMNSSRSSDPGRASMGPNPQKAFSLLAREHHKSLLTFTRALCGNAATAADLSQEAFLVAWRKLDDFDTTRDFGAWLRGIARNLWRDQLRKAGREFPVDEQILEHWEAVSVQWDQSRRDGRVELFDALEDCLGRMPETAGEAVNLYYYQDQEGPEAAKALGIDVTTFRKRLQRARQALRSCLDRKLPNPA